MSLTAQKFQAQTARVAARKKALESLADAIKLILQDRREDALRGLPSDVLRDTVVVK
jgi:hypothetical protein